jgi:hypothetical protein
MVTPHGHDHAQAHHHAHSHRHGPAAPHPAQAVAWSILRMAVLSRLMAALAVSAVLWGMIWLAIK